jgi:hypothetical protein
MITSGRNAMAELSDADKRVLLGADYKDREVKETPAERRVKRASMRNAAIGIAVLAAVILLAVLYGGGR